MKLLLTFVLAASMSGAWFALTAKADDGDRPTISLIEDDSKIEVRCGESSVLTYHKLPPEAPEGVHPTYRRSGFLHPVRTPAGGVVTAMFPSDHLHQHGIFSAWVRTTYGDREVDFWNLAGGTGRVLHEWLVETFTDRGAADFSAGFEVTLLHRAVEEPVQDVLRETWRVTVHATDGDYHCFDIDCEQRALTDVPLIVQEYHYGGMAARGPTQWLLNPRRGAEPPDDHADFAIMNDSRSDRLQGDLEPARWVAMSGAHEGNPVYLAVLCHPENFRFPQPARLHPNKPYFVFAPCAAGEFRIDRETPYRAKYRYLVVDGKPDPEWLDRQWDAWTPASADDLQHCHACR